MKKIFYLIFLIITLLLSQSFAEPPSYTVPVPPGGVGDVTAAANLTDNATVCGDGGVKGVKDCVDSTHGGNFVVTGVIQMDKGTGWGQIDLDGSSGGCLMIRDTDDAGWTECSALNGVLSCSTDADGQCDGS